MTKLNIDNDYIEEVLLCCNIAKELFVRNYIFSDWDKLYTKEIVDMVSKIHEYKGEQNLFIEANADALETLVEMAKIQSTEASNRIEGIYTSDDRLKKIVLNKTMPKTRSEQEIAGYRDVLKTVHDSYDYINIKSSVILQLHRDLYKFNANEDGGVFKTSDNQIQEKNPDGSTSVRFKPVHAWETEESMNALCEAYSKAINEDKIDPLLVLPVFILDFLCIHPFNDGNGRMSRILTLLLLYKSGYIVGKYVSFEKAIEKTKETYYEALKESSTNWHEEENDYEPFVKYMLGVIIYAYKDFSERVDLLISKNLSKPERVTEIVKTNLGKITKSEIHSKCPDISETTINRTLNDLQKSGEIKKIGGGRYTAYVWNGKDD